jgi:vancomycin resistance protein YoaR
MKIKYLFMALIALFLPSCKSKEENPSNERIENMQVETNKSYNKPNDLSSNNQKNNELNITNGLGNNFDFKRPDVQVQDLNQNSVLSTFKTKVYTKTNARVKNLQIVCGKINGKVIAPNEVFSYNSIAGPFNKQSGFGKATILLGDGREVQEYGGGVCQVSSTLYNAVKNVGVQILERHHHSKHVYYVPRYEDAAVSYGSLDFKFKNINDYSLRIEASADRNYVTVTIYKV